MVSYWPCVLYVCLGCMCVLLVMVRLFVINYWLKVMYVWFNGYLLVMCWLISGYVLVCAWFMGYWLLVMC